MQHTLDYKSKPSYDSYKKRHGAKYNNAPMISKETFEKLSASPCHYCGVPGPNGIDRIDSSKGYEPANCVPACKHCNYVKGNLSMEDFQAWTQRFVTYQNNNPIWEK